MSTPPRTAAATARVLVVDAHDIFPMALSREIGRDPAFELLAFVRSVPDAIAELARAAPDLVVVGIHLPAGGAAAVARAALARDPGIRVVVVSGLADQGAVFELLRGGACAYIPNDTPWPAARQALLDALARRPGGASAQAPADPPAPQPAATSGDATEERDAHERAALRRVIDERLLAVWWQPVAHLQTGRIVAAEALSRFQDTTLPGPAAWFGAAERLGLGTELELCAAQLAVECADAMPDDVLMSINAAPATVLDPRFEAVIAPVLPRVVVEVTERAPVEDYCALAARIVEWRGEGGRLAIDDTGAGFASLRHILELNPDFIKLDRILTDAVDRDHRRRALVTALVTFAREIGAGVVAEGVETKAELEALRALGVPYGQGWLLARPQPLAQGDFRKAVAFPMAAGAGVAGAIEAATAPEPVEFLDRVMGVRDAADHVSAVVAAALPGAAVHVAFLDAPRARWRVVASAGSGALQAGRSVPLDQAPCLRIAAGELPALCEDVGAEPEMPELGLLRVTAARSYACAVVELASGLPALSLLVLASASGSLAAPEHDLVSAGARVLVAALRRETASSAEEEAAERLRTAATVDPVSTALRRWAWQGEAHEVGRRRSHSSGPSALVVLRLEGLDGIRRRDGAMKVDLLLRACARTLRDAGQPTDLLGRLDDDRFAVLLTGWATEEALAGFTAGVRAACREVGRSFDCPFETGLEARALPVDGWRAALDEVLAGPA